MRQLLKITLLLLPVWGHSQTVSVYVNDTTFIAEPITLTSTDSTNGKITATYTNHNQAPAYVVNCFYGYRSGFVRILHPETGQLMRTLVYAKGQFNGESIFYNAEGKMVIKGTYVNNVKEGYWVYKNYGFMGEYKKGLKHGHWKYTLPDGSHGKMKFKKGVLEHGKKAPTVIPKYIPQSILMDGVTRL